MSDSSGGALVIRTGELGGFVHAMPAMAAIRAAYRGRRVVLLSNPPVDRLAVDSPYFDSVDAIEDLEDARALQLIGQKIRRAGFEKVFDFDRGDGASERIFTAAGPMRGRWSGPHRGAKYRFTNAEARGLHPVDAYLAQVAAAGVPIPKDVVAMPDSRWAATARRGAPSLKPDYFSISQPFVILAPAVARQGGAKRWPASRFAGLASRLGARGVGVVTYAHDIDRDATRAIVQACDTVKDLTSRADLVQLAALAVSCAAVVGHQDTPLVHLLAASGACTISIGAAPDRASSPAPRGRAVINLETDDAASVEVEYVASLIRMAAGVGGASDRAAYNG